ncbi:MAG TPA: hypothetical protein VM347_06755 [Nonomuraea sp.]|nr:hypothetical protein [Nonomuraea sp.]
MATSARVLLAVMRLFYGLTGLLAPGFLARRIGIDLQAAPAAGYVFRMFGVRTVLLGADLLTGTPEDRVEAARRGVLIHASDTLAAYLATRAEHFPGEGRVIVWISGLNTLLALLGSRR